MQFGPKLLSLQFCGSHLIRVVKFLAESKSKEIAEYGERLLKRNWLRRMQDHREAILQEAWKNIPAGSDCRLIAERLWNWRNGIALNYIWMQVYSFRKKITVK